MIVKTVLREKTRDKQVLSISQNVTVKEAAKSLIANNVGALLVRETTPDAPIIGIISERNIVMGLAKSTDQCFDVLVKDVMSAPLQFCHEDDTVDYVSQIMTDRRIRHLPVLDSQGALVGIITIGDVVKSRIDHANQEVDHLRHYVATSR